MKKCISLFMILVLMLTCFAFAETEITITGSGRISVPADSVVITLGVSETATTAAEAQENASKKISAIRAALTEAGIPENDILTDSINLSEVTEYLESGSSVVSGYYAYSSLGVRVREIEKSGEIVDLAVNSGANSISGVVFSNSNPGAYNEETIALACADANAKSILYAQAMGLTITGIRSINETSSDSFERGISFENYAAKAAGYTDIGINSVEVVTNVSITYIAE